jgi:23S rRNA (cytidine1920-2'-O)/16S rRNA (cytidine1409-2'-O)-methyltransferase
MKPRRLDLELVSRGLVESREQAQRLILAGEVWVDGQRWDKARKL